VRGKDFTRQAPQNCAGTVKVEICQVRPNPQLGSPAKRRAGAKRTLTFELFRVDAIQHDGKIKVILKTLVSQIVVSVPE
jgi:hypothetical protein